MTLDDSPDTSSFELADARIQNLLHCLHDERVCPCCIARAMAYHAAFLAERTMGTVEAIDMLKGIVMDLREGDVFTPDPLPSTEPH